MSVQADASQHIDELAEKHGIVVRRELRKGVRRSPRAYTGERRIVTHGINNDTDYLICLHEMGHIVNQDGARPEKECLFYEAEAWQWALANAKWPVHIASKLMVARSIASYRDHGSPTVPPAGHCYHQMIGWLRYGERPKRKPERRLP